MGDRERKKRAREKSYKGPGNKKTPKYYSSCFCVSLTASSRGLCGQLCARSDLDALIGARRVDSCSAHTVLDLLGHRHERLLDIGGALSRGLQEGNCELVGKLLGSRVLDHLLIGQIRLDADKKLVHALGGIAVNLGQPLLHVGKGVLVSDVVHDNDAVGAAVVRRSDGAETFLSCSVPL